MRFKEFLVEVYGGGAKWHPDEIKAMQELAKKADRDFEVNGPLAEFGPEPYSEEQVHTDVKKELYRKEPGKFMYDIEETVTGEDDEYPGNSYRTTDFADFMKRLTELLY